MALSKIAAPFVPFITEAIYINLRQQSMPDSVHLCRFPCYLKSEREFPLEEAMTSAQQVVSQGHALRKEHKLKVRQPLRLATIVSKDETILSFLKEQQNLIAEELNVKDILFDSDEEKYVFLIAKPNFRTLGKKIGQLMPAVQEAIGKFDRSQLQMLSSGHEVTLQINGESIVLTPEDVEVSRRVKEGFVASTINNFTIVLDTNLSEELLIEGLAREIINKINSMRRDQGFQVTDRIDVTIQGSPRLTECFIQYGEYISAEVLAKSFAFEATGDGTEWDLNGESAKIKVVKTV